MPRMAKFAIASMALVGLGLLLVVTINNAADPPSRRSTNYPKTSPFAAVRWQQAQPEVQLGQEWFKLVSLNDVPTADIVSFSKRTYADKWRKRFEEDLVEVLSRMGHPPESTVDLAVQPMDSPETIVREGVAMTEANRDAIWDAAQERTVLDSGEGSRRPAVSIEDRDQFRQRIDEYLHAAQVKTGFSGVVAVAQGDELVYQSALGYSHLQPKTANSLDTPFRIASLSKQFTGAAVLHLEAKGKLSIDDPVHLYLNEFAAEPYREITIHHLLTHTSGLPKSPRDLVGSIHWRSMSMRATPVNEYVQRACKCPLQFEPGQDYQYSNFGFRVLSALIERVSGQSYADFMRKELFQPLEMKQSGVARISQPRDEDKVAQELRFVKFDHSANEPIYATWNSGRNYGAGYGSGGIYSSANDLLRWDRVLAGDSFLSAKQKEKLFRPVKENYACGWIVKHSGLDGRLYHGHSGSNEGYFSKMMRIPGDDLVIIVLGNVDKTDQIDDAVTQLFRLCRSLPYQEL